MKNGHNNHSLTERQSLLMNFIEKYRAANDHNNPSQREMQEFLGGSLHSAQEILDALIKKRILGRKKGHARSLQILNPEWRSMPKQKMIRKNVMDRLN